METVALVDFWREIPGLPGYEVSRDGRIFSKLRRRQLKTFPRANGYVGFNALKDGKPAWPEVHRCLALAFHGEPPAPDAHAAHRDGDRTNNTDNNVVWKSPSENAADRVAHGRGGVRLTIEQRSLLSILASQGASSARIAQLVGCNHSTVRRIRGIA
jgi:DNA-binding CsgD family transcriptional regulator